MSEPIEQSQVLMIESCFKQLHEFLKTDKTKTWDRERGDRIQLYETLLSKDSMDRQTAVELCQILWRCLR